MKRFDFNDSWRFHKEGTATKTVDLPHDAMIEEGRDPDSPGGSAVAFFKPGTYVYEKAFSVPTDWNDKCITLQFEGVYRNSKVYINGKAAGGCAYGYVPLFISAGQLLKCGEENVIRVEVNNKDMPNSRWYSGAGIYRPVWLWIGDKSHIEIEGVKITTLSYNPARIRVETAHCGGEATVQIAYIGQSVASGKGDSVVMEIPNAKLWSDETPELYECRVTLNKDGTLVDEVTEAFGIRLVEWSPKGLLINGNETLLRGGCVHHDNGILGARSYAKAEERRVRIMKEAGFNAIRSSHNPASKAMLEACDRLGMYVMDETWDMWYSHKNKYDYATDFQANYRQDITAMVNRDFNHPSVIMYSIGNEISEPHQERGVALAKEMIESVRALDPGRAVTAGANLMIIHLAAKGKGIYKEEGGLASEDKQKKKQSVSGSLFFNMMTSVVGTGMNKAANSKGADAVTTPFLDALDIAGYNYASGRYPMEGKVHPNRIVVGSETFPQDIAKNWAMVKKYPYLVGDFMWTAWDYLGEVGIGTWAYTNDGASFSKPYPWLLADVGAIDILGHSNGEALRAAAVWGKLSKPAIAVQPVNHPGNSPKKAVWRGTNAIPSWAWKGCKGNIAVVEVYSDSASVELLLNGKSYGKKKVKECKVSFKIKYAPGTLTAVSYDTSGRESARSELCSAAGKTAIRVEPEELKIKAGEIAYVAIDLTGENDVVESNADTKLTVSVEGGELLAVGSANPRTEESYISGTFTTYYGRALAVVKCKMAGEVIVRVRGKGLEHASATISVI